MVFPNLERFKELPSFSNGRIDYSGAREAAGVYVIVMCQKEFLLLKRSSKVNSLKNEWFFCCGFLDEATKHIEDKALEELQEETSINKDAINSVEYLGKILVNDHGLWHIEIVVVLLQEKPGIILDWEHDEYRWVSFKEAVSLISRPGARKALEKVCEKIVL